jgi:hypothetical protein
LARWPLVAPCPVGLVSRCEGGVATLGGGTGDGDSVTEEPSRDGGRRPVKVDCLGRLEVGVMGATAQDRAQGAVGARFYSRAGLAIYDVGVVGFNNHVCGAARHGGC